MPDIFDQIQSAKGTGDIFDSLEVPKESFGKSSLRTALQVPQGIAEATKYGIGTGLWQLLGMGETLDPEEIDRIRQISEREGVPFDEEKYMEAIQNALGSVPTVSNIASKIEEKTGLPLEPKSKLQKLLRLGSTATKLQPGAISQKAAAGVVAPAAAIGLESAGVPEPFAELAGLAIGGATGAKSSKVDVNLKKTKPSGLTERQFEKLKQPRAVPHEKIEKINEKLESDFRNISEDILSTSPIEETRKAIKENPKFKAEIAKKFRDVEDLAESIPNKIHTDTIKKNLVDNVLKKKGTGFAPSEYDKDFRKFIAGFIKETPKQEIGAADLVHQYRKNNKALTEYFAPGESKAFNRAKKDALLEYNRAIADTIEKEFPKSEFSNLFKDTNKQWAEISDAEAIDSFVDNLFKEGPQFRKGKRLFESENQARPFKRAMGEENFKRFEQLMTDMLSTEKPYKMLRVAKSKGMNDLVNTGAAYILHPKLAIGKIALDTAKNIFSGIVNFMLDKPQFTLTWKKGIDALKKGQFTQAQKEFDKLKTGESAFEAREKSRVEALKKAKENIKNRSAKSEEIKNPKNETVDVQTTKIDTSPNTLSETLKPNQIEYKTNIEENPNEFRDRFMAKMDLGISERIDSMGKKAPKSKPKPPKLPANQTKSSPDKSKPQSPSKYDTQLFLHEESKKPFAGSTTAQGNMITALVEPGETFKDVFKKINYDPEAKAIVKEYIDSGYGDIPLEIDNYGRIKAFKKINTNNTKPKTKETPKVKPKSPNTKLKGLSEDETIAEMAKRYPNSKFAEKTASSLSENKIKEIKRQDISKQGLKTQKQYILDHVEEALTRKLKGDTVTFDVPGDGVFKIHNNETALKKFAELVKKKWPDKAMRAPAKRRPIEYKAHELKEYEIAQEKALQKELKRVKDLRK